MRWGWLLPDASYEVLYEGWERQSYEPQHGRPPFVIRGVYSAAMALERARARYLGAVEEEAVAGARGQATMGGRAAAAARAVTGSGAGLRATAGLGASGVGVSTRVGASGLGASGLGASGVGASGLGTASTGKGGPGTATSRGTAASRGSAGRRHRTAD